MVTVCRWPMTCSNDIEIRWKIWYWQSATTITHKSRRAQSKCRLQQPDQMRTWCFVSHTHTHVITQGEKIETSTDLKFNPLAKDANHSLIMYVCVCLCVLGGRRAQDLVSSHFYYLLCLHEGFEQRERTERERWKVHLCGTTAHVCCMRY